MQWLQLTGFRRVRRSIVHRSIDRSVHNIRRKLHAALVELLHVVPVPRLIANVVGPSLQSAFRWPMVHHLISAATTAQVFALSIMDDSGIKLWLSEESPVNQGLKGRTSAMLELGMSSTDDAFRPYSPASHPSLLRPTVLTSMESGTSCHC